MASVPDTLELRLWLNSFGAEVEVLGPPALREEFAEQGDANGQFVSWKGSEVVNNHTDLVTLAQPQGRAQVIESERVLLVLLARPFRNFVVSIGND